MEPQRDFGFSDLMEKDVPPEDVAEILGLDREKVDEGTLDGQEVPGTGKKSILDISEDQKVKLSRELCDLLIRHDEMMADRWERDRKVEDAYALMEDTTKTGVYPGAAQMASEMTMSAVDQANARIARAILDVTPIMEVSPIEQSSFSGDIALETAEAAQDFLENYTRDVVRIEDLIPLVTLRCTKLGTAVVYASWKECIEKYKVYGLSGKIQEVTKDKSGIEACLIRNSDVVLWPPWIQDWQREYEVVGHRVQLTISQWRVKAKYLGLTETEIEEIENFSSHASINDDTIDNLNREGIDASVSQEEQGIVTVTELWCYRLLPDGEEPVRFQAFLHEGLRKILWIDVNRLHSQKHPYFPVRYKKVDGSAWGTGLGHEIAYCQAADTAFRNLELDNLMSLAFVMVLLKQGTTADAVMDRPYPGMRVSTEDPEGDVKALSLASQGSDALAVLYQAMQANEKRKTDASGLASVLSGQGDPTMKSGAGTGSTMALIEQAGKKFGHVDQSIRGDLTRLWEMFLDLVAQYAADGIYYSKTSDDNARTLRQLRYVPKQGSVSDFFRIRAHSASAAQNKEMTKQNMLVVDQFMNQRIMLMMQLAQQYYQAENPAGMPQFLLECLETLKFMGEKVLEVQEVPGIKGELPAVQEPTPAEDKINELTQQNAQLQQQVQQLQQPPMPPPGAPPMGPEAGAPPPEMAPPMPPEMGMA